MKKNIINGIFGVVAIMSVFFACGEASTITSQLIWSGAWLALAGISVAVMNATMSEEDMEENA